MEDEVAFLPEDERIQLEYLESLLSNLTPKNIEKIVRKIKNLQFKTRNQLQHLSDLIFKFVVQRPDKVKEYACLCKEIKDLKVTILRFETIDEKESLEIANLRFHILLTTRVEIAYDQLGAIKDGFELFSQQMQNGSLVEVLRFVKNQMAFAGELYKHDLVTTEFLFAAINRLSLMAEMSDFFLECMISLLEKTAKDVEARNFSLGRYFKQLKTVAINNTVDNGLIDRSKDLLKLRATKWLGGEEEVAPEYVENLVIDENFKQRTLKAVKEELAKYISLDRCRSCCLEFEPSDRINHLTVKQHTTSMQTLLRDQYDGNLISCRERSCVICQEIDIERPFVHFNTQKHKINSTTYCYICQAKFTSAFYLSMHLKSLNHRKEILGMYDSILETTLLAELIAKENDILASDDSDDNNDNALLDYERYDRLINENAGLKNNIFKYLDLITAEEFNKDEQGLHERVMEQLDRFIENIYITKDISTENTLELLKQFNQEVEDVKAAVKCVKGEFPVVSEAAKKGIMQQHNLVNLLKDQYTELCEDMKKKLAELNKVRTEHEDKKASGEPLGQDKLPRTNDPPAVDQSKSTYEETCQDTSLLPKSQEYIHPQPKVRDNKDICTNSESMTNSDPHESALIVNLKENLDLTENKITCNGSLEQLVNIPKDTSKAIITATEEENIDCTDNKVTHSDDMLSSDVLINKHNVSLAELHVNQDGKLLRTTSGSGATNFVENNCGKNEISGSDILNVNMNIPSKTGTTQLNIEPETVNLPTYNGVGTNLTIDHCSGESKDDKNSINKEPIQQLLLTISELKITTEHEKDNSKDYKTVQDKNIAKGKHQGCEIKKNTITSAKSKRTKVKNKNKTVMTEKCAYSKIKVTHQEKCKSDNLSFESKRMGTTKWHVMGHVDGSSNQQSEKIQIKIDSTENDTNIQKPTKTQLKISKKDNSYIKMTVDQMNQGDKEDKSQSENPKKGDQNMTGIETPENVSNVTNETSSYTEYASNIAQSDQDTNSREKGEGTRLFNLKRIKIKIFARLKRKIPEKLRSENSDKHGLDEEKVVIEVTSLIKKVYMSEDIPLGLTLGLFENFNKDLESTIKDLEKR